MPTKALTRPFKGFCPLKPLWGSNLLERAKSTRGPNKAARSLTVRCIIMVAILLSLVGATEVAVICGCVVSVAAVLCLFYSMLFYMLMDKLDSASGTVHGLEEQVATHTSFATAMHWLHWLVNTLPREKHELEQQTLRICWSGFTQPLRIVESRRRLVILKSCKSNEHKNYWEKKRYNI